MNRVQPLAARWLGSVLCVASVAFGAVAAHAQAWQWTDEAGRKVYSDRPPPPTVPERAILKRPDTPLPPSAPTTPATPQSPGTPAAGQTAAPAGAVAGTDSELEKRKKAAEQNDAAKQKVIEQQNAKIRADNCRRARAAKATLESGVRLSTTNPKGERVFVDDGMRAEEARRINQVIQSNCGPAPAAAAPAQ
ncbi:MAG: hypothetical protein RJA09_2340 [Pseudomonadota bacterium]